jgi:hypothetical protein
MEDRMSAVLRDPSDPDKRAAILAYEAECLRVPRETLLTEGTLIRERGRAVTEVGLRGWAPDTMIVCAVEGSGATQRWEWGVWRDSVLDPEGDAPTPSDAQILVSILITSLEE